ncbi:MAG: hypothetical protein HKN21_01970, partial [Candidatus Eisenbacteria bacterium]|nr:hypothetical protein [Candidatus Eisenbacteria bacterium]
MATRIPALFLSNRRVLPTILTTFLAVLVSSLFVGSATAQIAPPKPGVELPQSYLQKMAEDKTAFQFRRAWKGEAMRVRENIRLQGLGILDAASAGGGTVVTGTKLVPVLAGKFSNTGADPYSIASLQNQLFDGPNPTGTVTDFYNETSHGNINLTGTVFGNGAGLFQVSQTDTYYEGSPGCNGLNSACGARTGEFLQEMLNGTDGTVDFSQYDNDGPDGFPNSGDDDGFVDFVAFVHPELGGECGTNNLWSHRWVYEGWWGSAYTTNDPAFGGGFIRVSDYTIQPLISCNGTSI